jgi:hypothetical protein
MVVIALAFEASFVAFHAAWYWRLCIFFPAAAAAIGFLQVRRDTCVLRAAEGTFEHDDGSTTPRPATTYARAAPSRGRSSATRS